MKKITIFSSSGGGGHTAVANALCAYLDTHYEVEVTNVFSQMLRPLDFAQSLSKGKFCGEDFYNFCMAKKWYQVLNIYYRLGSTYYQLFNKKVVRILHQHLDEKQPDLIISVVPLVNHCILKVAQERNIPFLLIPTDLDISTFIAGIKNPSFDQFNLALAYSNQGMEKKISTAHIQPSQYITTGFVLRPDFFEYKNKADIKKQYNIPLEKPVVLLLLGAVGLKALYDFVVELSKVSVATHLLICIGRQEELRKKIEVFPFPSHISITVIGFTNRISDLMAVSDLSITKSGSVSFSEALYMNLPMVLDATTSLLRWEAYNHQFIEQNGFGTTIKNITQLSILVTKLLKEKNDLIFYKFNLTAFAKKHGGNEITQLIHKIMVSESKCQVVWKKDEKSIIGEWDGDL